MVLAGVAGFTSIIALILPAEQNSKLRARMKAVARERGKLRDKRLSELSMSKLRGGKQSTLQRIIAHLPTITKALPDNLTQQLRQAGFRDPAAQSAFMFFRLITPMAFFALIFTAAIIWPGKDISVHSALLLAIAGGGIGAGLPRLVLGRLIARRQKALLRAFPDALDLLLICVQSGMSVEAALAKVTRDISSQSIALAEELSLTMAELAYLPSRWRAYQNLGDRTGLPAVKLIAAALAQAERYGTSISQALTAAALECREARIEEAEKKAAALPPKMAIPLVVFFLPILLTIILAPAIMQVGTVLRDKNSPFSAKTDRKAALSPHVPAVVKR